MNNATLFRPLAPEEQIALRSWARRHHRPGHRINPLWHPAIQNEAARMNAETARDDRDRIIYHREGEPKIEREIRRTLDARYRVDRFWFYYRPEEGDEKRFFFEVPPGGYPATLAWATCQDLIDLADQYEPRLFGGPMR